MSGFFDYPVYAVSEQLPTAVGQGKRGILVIITPISQEVEPEVAYLGQIVKAVGLDPWDQYAWLINLPAGEKFNLAAILQAWNPQTVLFFGVDTSLGGLRAQFAAYTPLRLGGRTMLWSDALGHIQADRARGDSTKAGQLWKALQTLFAE